MTIHRMSHWISPSLLTTESSDLPAYETKFVVAADLAEAVWEWLSGKLLPDPYARNGPYKVTSIYYDTGPLDLFHRNPDYGIHKYRLRRYGSDFTIHLERKSKKEGRVWKIRTSYGSRDGAFPNLSSNESPLGETEWFWEEVNRLGMKPTCEVSYERLALVGSSATGPIRFTLDRNPTGRLLIPSSQAGGKPESDFIPGQRVLEMKYLATMPGLFRDAMTQFHLNPTGISKYRSCLVSHGLNPKQDPSGVD